MLELAFIACTLNACENRVLTYSAEEVSIMECIMYGQAELAKWAVDRPGWYIKKWKCRYAGQTANL